MDSLHLFSLQINYIVLQFLADLIKNIQYPHTCVNKGEMKVDSTIFSKQLKLLHCSVELRKSADQNIQRAHNFSV